MVLITKILGVDSGTKDLTFDFPHTLSEIKVDTTPMHIGPPGHENRTLELIERCAGTQSEFRF